MTHWGDDDVGYSGEGTAAGQNWMVIYFVCHSSTYNLSIKDKVLSEQRH